MLYYVPSPVTALNASRSSQGPVANSTAWDMSRCERVLLCIATRWGALLHHPSKPSQAIGGSGSCCAWRPGGGPHLQHHSQPSQAGPRQPPAAPAVLGATPTPGPYPISTQSIPRMHLKRIAAPPDGAHWPDREHSRAVSHATMAWECPAGTRGCP